MSNYKHTPGPWKAVYVGCGDWDLTGPITQEDWTLAASAPDLLEALEGLLWYVDQLEKVVYETDDTETHESVGNARATIAKAKGESK